jgi:hypothetical protein
MLVVKKMPECGASGAELKFLSVMLIAFRMSITLR